MSEDNDGGTPFDKANPKMWVCHLKGGDAYYFFWCPGCKKLHPYLAPRWTFNGNIEKPTFTPSLKMLDSGCHLFVTDGKIQYCPDSPHEFAGKTIDMVEIPEDWC